jgi:hypothetical protein
MLACREIEQVHGFFDQSSRRFVQPGWDGSYLHENLPISVVAHVRADVLKQIEASWTSLSPAWLP